MNIMYVLLLVLTRLVLTQLDITWYLVELAKMSSRLGRLVALLGERGQQAGWCSLPSLVTLAISSTLFWFAERLFQGFQPMSSRQSVDACMPDAYAAWRNLKRCTHWLRNTQISRTFKELWWGPTHFRDNCDICGSLILERIWRFCSRNISKFLLQSFIDYGNNLERWKTSLEQCLQNEIPYNFLLQS